MVSRNEKNKCCGCGACANVCPQKTIVMEADEEGFLYPKVGKECEKCGLCNKVCPAENKKINKQEPITYIVQNKDEIIRKKSSSGGAFSAFALNIIDRGGVVYGAAFDECMNVVHKRVNDIIGLEDLRGSKYVQSDLKDTFMKVKKDLDENIEVCFSGTPCQIFGLKNFLMKEYSNLFLIDVVCHGVPSPVLWKKYINEKEIRWKKHIISVGFRDKRLGYKIASMRLDFEDKTSKWMVPPDLFFNAFFSEICSRPSCYACQFKSKYYGSDITMFDCWHTAQLAPEMNDNSGATYVMIHSVKGNKNFDRAKKYFKYVITDTQMAIELDGSMIEKSAIPNKNRQLFFRDLGKYSIKKLTKKYIPKSIKQAVKDKVKIMLNLLGILPIYMKIFSK